MNNHAYLDDLNPEDFLWSSDESDDEDGDERSGHPLETKAAVLENLRTGFSYHKNGPAQEYDWTPAEITLMTQMIRDTHSETKAATKNKHRIIRAQNFRGESSQNTLRNWVNSCLSGQRFPDNPRVRRGPRIGHNDWSNFKQWEYVSETLQHEFHYWSEVEKINRSLPSERQKEVRYPRLDDLIFRHNDDFTGGHWSHFAKFWDPFIDEMR